MRPILRRLRPFLLAVLLPAAAPVAAQAQPGRIEGQAVSAGDGAPIAYALVRLRSPDDRTGSTAVTDAEGRFAFPDVPAGRWRLGLNRIGFQADAPQEVEVAAGATTTVRLEGQPRVLQIAGIVSSGACYRKRDLDRAPAVRDLWEAALTALATRQAFDETFRYRYATVQITRYMTPRGDDAQHDTLIQAVASTPQARRTEARRRMRSGWGGLSAGDLVLEVPHGTELLAPDFLDRYCLEASSGAGDGVWEISFRPIRQQPGRIDVMGVLTLDRTTFQLRSVSLEYVQRTRTLLTSRVDFRDLTLPGGTVRLPVTGVFEGRPYSALALGRTRVEGEFYFLEYGEVTRPEG